MKSVLTELERKAAKRIAHHLGYVHCHDAIREDTVDIALNIARLALGLDDLEGEIWHLKNSEFETLVYRSLFTEYPNLKKGWTEEFLARIFAD